MKPRFLLILVVISAWAASAIIAQAQSAYPSSSAIDSKGVLHRGEKYAGKTPPWMDDCINAVPFDYPYEERRFRHQGDGYFRLILDPKTGAVTRVIVKKSTGFFVLDRTAIRALERWKWKPGKWKEIGMPVRFTLSRPPLRR